MLIFSPKTRKTPPPQNGNFRKFSDALKRPLHGRVALALTTIKQSELAQRSGVTRAYISDLETRRSGLPKPETATRIAQALGASVEEVFGPPKAPIDETLARIEERLAAIETTLKEIDKKR